MSEKYLTRVDLYNLVWSIPMTHIGKDFGMSDVAVRKHCVKHEIPTPQVGHWAKVAHGKFVKQPTLPNTNRPADEPVYLMKREVRTNSPESERAAIAAASKLNDFRSGLGVPVSLPNKVHPIVKAIRAGLRRTKLDERGFLNLEEANLPDISIGRESTDRVLRILQAVFAFAEDQGHVIHRMDRGFYWLVDDERFLLRVYAMPDKKPHEPTAKELKKQAQEDAWRTNYPATYSSNRKVYRTWDYFPSGRLTIALRDANSYGWQENELSKRWRDRKAVTLEDRLAEIFVWLASASVMAREKRLEAEAMQRREAEEAERQRRLRERHDQATKLETYLIELGDTHAKMRGQDDLIAFLMKSESPPEVLLRLVAEAQAYRRVLQDRLGGEEVSDRLEKLKLELGEELLMPALAEPPEPSYRPWLR